MQIFGRSVTTGLTYSSILLLQVAGYGSQSKTSPLNPDVKPRIYGTVQNGRLALWVDATFIACCGWDYRDLIAIAYK